MPYTNKYKILNYGSAKKRRNEHVSEIVLTYKIDVLGHNNPLTQKTYKKLALICKNNGDTYNALKYARFTSMYDKINSFYKFEPTCVENYDSLKVTIHEYVQLIAKAFGRYSFEFAISLNELGLCLLRLNKPDQAVNTFLRAIKIFEDYYPDERTVKKTRDSIYIWYATIYNNLALAYSQVPDNTQQKIKYVQAEKFYYKSLDILKEYIDEKHPRVFKIINDIAILYERWGKIKNAKILLKQQLEFITSDRLVGISKSNYATKLRDHATLQYNLARLYHEYDNNYHVAIKEYKLSQKIYRKGSEELNLFDMDIFFILKIDNQIGICLLQLGEYEQAEVLYNDILKRLQCKNGAEESDFAIKVHLNLDIVRKRQRKYGHIYNKRYENRDDV